MTDPLLNGHGAKDKENEALTKEVIDVVAMVSGKGGWSLDTDLVSAGLDSMVLLDILAALEHRFSLVLTEDLISDFRTIRGIVRIVEDEIRSSGKG